MRTRLAQTTPGSSTWTGLAARLLCFPWSSASPRSVPALPRRSPPAPPTARSGGPPPGTSAARLLPRRARRHRQPHGLRLRARSGGPPPGTSAAPTASAPRAPPLPAARPPPPCPLHRRPPSPRRRCRRRRVLIVVRRHARARPRAPRGARTPAAAPRGTRPPGSATRPRGMESPPPALRQPWLAVRRRLPVSERSGHEQRLDRDRWFCAAKFHLHDADITALPPRSPALTPSPRGTAGRHCRTRTAWAPRSGRPVTRPSGNRRSRSPC
uniref:Uncharacterized protein n=1 Tax=Setaria viridis TaxID=4556 RepID=A0A4U6UZD6_SETVI|nr:hypothetical protein SEVIR_5G315632v2 [Setaria viridis]